MLLSLTVNQEFASKFIILLPLTFPLSPSVSKDEHRQHAYGPKDEYKLWICMFVCACVIGDPAPVIPP